MAKPFLNCTKINASISQDIAARMPEAVRMEIGEAHSLSRSLNQIVDRKAGKPPSTF